MFATLAPKISLGDAMEFDVYQRQQIVKCRLISLADAAEECVDFLR
jgi:hypothetical protein